MIQYIKKKMVIFLKRKHYLPVYRKDILEYALKHRNFSGLCGTLQSALDEFNIVKTSYTIFPKFNIEEAKRFGGINDYYWWWPIGVWDTGRLDYLKWLYDQYKDNTEDLRGL